MIPEGFSSIFILRFFLIKLLGFSSYTTPILIQAIPYEINRYKKQIRNRSFLNWYLETLRKKRRIKESVIPWYSIGAEK